MIEPVFIIGLPRTGSTLWSNIMAEDPSLMRFGEMHFLHPWHPDFRTFIRSLDAPPSTRKGRVQLLEHLFSDADHKGLRGNYWQQIKRIEPEMLKRRLDHRLAESDGSLGCIFRSLVEESIRIRGYTKALIKFPVFPTHMGRLLDWYPECRIIHITRDPRATALSKTSDPGGTAKRLKRYPYAAYPIRQIMKLAVLAQYRWTARVHQKYANSSNYTLFGYEDLMAHPEQTIKRLCSATGIQFNESMLIPDEGQPSSLTGRKHKGLDPISAVRWQESIGTFESALMKACVRDSMRKLGYDPEHHDVFKMTGKNPR